MSLRSTINKLGPGLLYAAAAIGVSHLVQSTRAGANYGFELVWVILLANVLKYPFYKIGPLYTTLTGKSLLSAYRKQGRWAVATFLIMTLTTMFTIQAAVTIVSAGLFSEIFGLPINLISQAYIILTFSALLIIIGKYQILDSFIKFVIILLTVTTLFSVIASFTTITPSETPTRSFSFLNTADIFFFIALIGWMPAPMDIPVWHSLWTVAKLKDSKISIKDSLLDFNIGFIGTAILAIAFLSLGAIIMHPTGEKFAASATGFSSQLISLYTNSLGSWAYILIAAAAFTTMLSTTITCLDAFGRITSESFKEFGVYNVLKSQTLWVMLTSIGASVILSFYIKNMKLLVDIATSVSFVAAPIYAYLNFKVIISDEIPEKHRYKRPEIVLCYIGLVFFTCFSLYFISLKI